MQMKLVAKWRRENLLKSKKTGSEDECKPRRRSGSWNCILPVEFCVILNNQGRRRRLTCGGLMRKKPCLERLLNSVMLFMESMLNGDRKSGKWSVKMLRWWFGMEAERQLEHIDRKLMRSILLSNSCDIRFKRSFGSSDQSTGIAIAMDDACWIVDSLFFFFIFGVRDRLGLVVSRFLCRVSHIYILVVLYIY